MKPLSSCKQSIQSCLENKTFAVAHLYNDEKPMDMHIHDCYEIYYSISGGKQFLIDNRFYDIQPGDLFFINQYEGHHLTQIDQAVHERIVLSVHPDFIREISSAQTDLDYCFHHREDALSHRLHLNEDGQNRFRYLIHKISSTSGFGSDLEDAAIFTELMVYLTRIYHETEADQRASRAEAEDGNISCSQSSGQPSGTFLPVSNSVQYRQVDAILTYINQHISEPLSIDELSDHFFLSSSYLCRIFKAATGTTINKYITAKRITMAKSLLSSGYNVTDTCEKCGFNDYSNFLKAFTRAVGISPKKYAQCSSC